ncbi:MAG TPA: carboxyltransferase domain-containing protein [Thermoanaerobaculia bacterium]|nr:carboxyltransferase domain-containing protein [Thermoanaerobaculia bacterium]
MHLAPAGDRAALVVLDDSIPAETLHAAAAYARSMEGVIHVVPGHSSLLVHWSGEPPRALFEAWPRFERASVAASAAREMHVVFEGEDLAGFLEMHALTRDAFLARVATLTLTARYLGFRAGFAYLDGWPDEWAMPRRATSRKVKRGSFAIAGNVAGFYPLDSPGGWNILGHTEDAPHIEAGERIRLVPVAASRSDRAQGVEESPSVPHNEFSLIHSPLVVETAKPFDDVLARIATNAVKGDVVLLECPMVGPRIRFHRDAVIAWCDASVEVRRVHAGDELAFGRVTNGLRGYLAIGDGEGVREEIPDRSDRLVVHAIRGPHDVAIDDVACEVTPQLDRVGIRLRPLRELRIEVPADLKSIGMQCGSVQLHPDGSLVAMGPDHPVTGGYLQPMTVITSERWKLAQLRPGERVTFTTRTDSRFARPL